MQSKEGSSDLREEMLWHHVTRFVAPEPGESSSNAVSEGRGSPAPPWVWDSSSALQVGALLRPANGAALMLSLAVLCFQIQT